MRCGINAKFRFGGYDGMVKSMSRLRDGAVEAAKRKRSVHVDRGARLATFQSAQPHNRPLSDTRKNGSRCFRFFIAKIRRPAGGLELSSSSSLVPAAGASIIMRASVAHILRTRIPGRVAPG